MRLIDADTVVTIQTYDDMYEEWGLETMTVAKALDKFADEGCPPTIEAVSVVLCKDCKHRATKNCPMLCSATNSIGETRVIWDCSEHNGFCHFGAKMDAKE